MSSEKMHLLLVLLQPGRPAWSCPSWTNCPPGARVSSRSPRSASAGWASSSFPAATPTPRPLRSTGQAWARTFTRPATSRRSQSCTTTTASPRACKVTSLCTKFQKKKKKKILMGRQRKSSFPEIVAFVVSSASALRLVVFRSVNEFQGRTSSLWVSPLWN